MHKASHARRGFTLIELLLVIGIIAILASIVIVAINPTKQLGDARNSQRRSDVNTILSAVYQYAIDHNGNYPYDLQKLVNAGDLTPYDICKCNATTCAVTGVTLGVTLPDCDGELRVNLRELTGSYVLAIPEDPRYSSGSSTEYTISVTNNNRIQVCSNYAEPVGESEPLCVTR